MIEVVGKYVFGPLAITKAADLFKTWWVIIRLDDDDDTSDYYRWFIERRYGLKLYKH